MIDPRHLLLLAFLPALHAAELHVAVSGEDTNPGTEASPSSTASSTSPAATRSSGFENFPMDSLRARPGQPLGTFRWIVWTTTPVTPAGENTAFQELAVEPAR